MQGVKMVKGDEQGSHFIFSTCVSVIQCAEFSVALFGTIVIFLSGHQLSHKTHETSAGITYVTLMYMHFLKTGPKLFIRFWRFTSASLSFLLFYLHIPWPRSQVPFPANVTFLLH